MYLQCPRDTIGHYERGKDAREIAEAIAAKAVDLRDAAEMQLYADYESSNNLDATGDKGGSHGAWQIPVVLLGAERQLAYWLSLREHSVAVCTDNGRATKLAALASGSCDRALRKVRLRNEVIERLAEEFSHVHSQ